MNQAELQNWIPYKLHEQYNSLCCRWCDAGVKPFSEPFFDESLSRILRESKINRSFHSTSITDMMGEWLGKQEAVQPAAVIFHISRCGSTLLSQLLSLNNKNISLSEVPFFDEILRKGLGQNDSPFLDTSLLLQQAVNWYSQKRTGGEEHVFIKTDSWHLFFYTVYRKLFPSVPFVLLYRSPDEVIRSQQKRRGMQSVPGLIEPSVFGFTSEEAACTDLDQYMALVLEKYFDKMLASANNDKHILLANYNEGLANISCRIFNATGIALTGTDAAFIKDRSNYHGKYPGETFMQEKEPLPEGDYLKKVMELYQQLEEKRKQLLQR